jgi:hypothetical protein
MRYDVKSFLHHFYFQDDERQHIIKIREDRHTHCKFLFAPVGRKMDASGYNLKRNVFMSP